MLKFLLTAGKKYDIINMLCWCFEKILIFFEKPIDKRGCICYNIIRWRKSADRKEYGSVPERPKGADCKSVVTDFGGPNPPAPTNKKTRHSSGLFVAERGCRESPNARVVAQYPLCMLHFPRRPSRLRLGVWSRIHPLLFSPPLTTNFTLQPSGSML